MKYKIKIFLLVSFFIILPLAASAAVSIPYFGGTPPFASCSGVNCTTCDLFETGQRVIYFIMTMALFVFGPIMVTAGGIMMLISGGNEERFTSGRKMATGAVIGILIALGAFLIVNTLLATIAQRITGFEGSGFTINCSATSPYVPPRNQPSQNQNLICDPTGYCAPGPSNQNAPASTTDPTNVERDS